MNCKIKIIDNVHCVEKEILYEFPHFITYLYLFNELPNLYNTNVKSEVTMYFIYLGKRENVTNLEKYILNGDEIEIVLNRELPIYMLCDSKTGDMIHSSRNIKDLYKIFYENVYDCEIFLISRCGADFKLVDVLDLGIRHYNDCVNRLIHRYNY